MTKEQFCALPPALALSLVWDAMQLQSTALGTMPEPKRAGPPRYDMRVYRKGGHCWASEMNLDSLRYWHRKATEGAASGSKYAEKDAKKAKQLDYWIAWRAIEPETAWNGTRDNAATFAAPPSRDPTIYSRDAQPTGDPEPEPSATEDDDIPF